MLHAVALNCSAALQGTTQHGEEQQCFAISTMLSSVCVREGDRNRDITRYIDIISFYFTSGHGQVYINDSCSIHGDTSGGTPPLTLPGHFHAFQWCQGESISGNPIQPCSSADEYWPKLYYRQTASQTKNLSLLRCVFVLQPLLMVGLGWMLMLYPAPE